MLPHDADWAMKSPETVVPFFRLLELMNAFHAFPLLLQQKENASGKL